MLKYSTSEEKTMSLVEIKNQYFYPSGRPRTTMSFIPEPKVKELTGQIVEARPDNELIANLDVGEYVNLSIPILRYAHGMSRGTYHLGNGENLSYCGTFYYYDIGSNLFLNSGKTLVSFNKASAYKYLAGDEEINANKPSDIFYNFVRSLGKGDINAFVRGDYSKLPFDENGILKNGNYADYMYASEDEFDQPLCVKARENGYDCVILLRMFGKNRIVTEVLDTRDRSVSFDNIYKVL